MHIARPTRSQWRRLAAEAGVSENTTGRIRKGLPVRPVSLLRLREAADRLGLQVEIVDARPEA